MKKQAKRLLLNSSLTAWISYFESLLQQMRDVAHRYENQSRAKRTALFFSV